MIYVRIERVPALWTTALRVDVVGWLAGLHSEGDKSWILLYNTLRYMYIPLA